MASERAEPAPRDAFLDGIRTISPLLVGVVPFGLILGVAAGGAVMGTGLAWSTSPIIFGGAAQLVTIELTNAGAAAIVVAATALVVNARHLMYSAAFADHFREFPRAWRFGLPYIMTDQVFAVSINRFAEVTDPAYKRWFYLGAGLTMWVPWMITTATGAIVGASIPESWSLDFAIPLVFMVLIIPSLERRPGICAAVVGAVVAVVARDVPYALGLIIAAFAGISAGVALDRMRSPR